MKEKINISNIVIRQQESFLRWYPLCNSDSIDIPEYEII